MTIEYHYEVSFRLDDETKFSDWINRIIESEKARLGPLNFIFCDDTYLLELNQKYLRHDTFTDIITFDYSEGEHISGDVFISVERVKENAREFTVGLKEEMRRVMAHGVLHLLGYKDKTREEQIEMRMKEDEKIEMFHVEH